MGFESRHIQDDPNAPIRNRRHKQAARKAVLGALDAGRVLGNFQKRSAARRKKRPPPTFKRPLKNITLTLRYCHRIGNAPSPEVVRCRCKKGPGIKACKHVEEALKAALGQAVCLVYGPGPVTVPREMATQLLESDQRAAEADLLFYQAREGIITHQGKRAIVVATGTLNNPSLEMPEALFQPGGGGPGSYNRVIAPWYRG